MQDLRLIGVHEDGAHLILGDVDGNRYRLPLDEPLRAAARRDRPRLGQLQLEIEGGLRPKDVQSMIRAGLSAEEAAERAGWPVEKVHRYEGPILAEREHVAGLGQQVRLRDRAGSTGGTTLGGRVAERLHSRQIDAVAARWDSRREEANRWILTLYFNAGGRQRQAEWAFDLTARTAAPLDDEARWLSEDDDASAPGPIPAPHLAAERASQVYDVEAEGGLDAPGRRSREAETVDLMAAMRERSSKRGRRRRPRATDAPGLDRAPEDALPLVTLTMPVHEAGDPPAAHPHPEDDPAVARDVPPESDAGSVKDAASVKDVASVKDAEPARDAASVRAGANGKAAPRERATRGKAAAEEGQDRGNVAGEADPASDDVTEDDEAEAPSVTAESAPVPTPRPRRAAPDGAASRSEQDGAATAKRSGAPRKGGRTSVPSWDDIMFGKKTE
jgi:hypothetical protein